MNIATITLNPAYDLTGTVHDIAHGEVNIVQTLGAYAAGKGINVAKVLRRLECDVMASGFLGRENPDGFYQLFKNQGIANRFHLVDGSTRTNIKIREENGVMTDLNFTGFGVTADDWQAFTQASLAWATEYDLICVSGSVPQGVAMSDFTHWLTQLRSICDRVVLDSSGDALIAGVQAKPWLIKPNLRELETLVGASLTTHQDIIQHALQLCQTGIEHVIVSLGAEGAIWINTSEHWFAQPPQCDVVSTVGAGDSMVAGFIYGLMQPHYHHETVFRTAAAISALAVTQTHVGEWDSQQLITMEDQIVLKPITIDTISLEGENG